MITKEHDSYALVYQGGLANVFRIVYDKEKSYRHRLFQGTFSEAEHFARGIRAAGGFVKVYACNRTGDIRNLPWSTGDLDAPFKKERAYRVFEVLE